jgi:hypothetical protein
MEGNYLILYVLLNKNSNNRVPVFKCMNLEIRFKL